MQLENGHISHQKAKSHVFDGQRQVSDLFDHRLLTWEAKVEESSDAFHAIVICY